MPQQSSTPAAAVATSPPSTRHIPGLDGVRGLAVLLVLVGHLIALPSVGIVAAILGRVGRIGWVGVDLFFVLSGFLITGILVDTRDEPGYFRSFYARRALRIFPLYYAFLASLILLVTIAPHFTTETAQAHQLIKLQGWYWTYMVNVLVARAGTWDIAPLNTFHLWSLAVEEQFYLAWPLLVWLVPRQRLRALSAAAIGVSLAARLWLRAQGAQPLALYALTITHLDPLAIGAWVALTVREPDGLARLRRLAPVVGIIGAVGIAAIVATAHGVQPRDTLAMQTVGYPLIGALCAALLLSALGDASQLTGRLIDAAWRWAPLRYLGRRSYAIYLLHFPLLVVLADRRITYDRLAARFGSPLIGQAAYLLLASGLSVLAAEVTWRTIESPMLRLRPARGRGATSSRTTPAEGVSAS